MNDILNKDMECACHCLLCTTGNHCRMSINGCDQPLKTPEDVSLWYKQSLKSVGLFEEEDNNESDFSE